MTVLFLEGGSHTWKTGIYIEKAHGSFQVHNVIQKTTHEQRKTVQASC